MVHDAGDVFAPQVPLLDDGGQFVMPPEDGAASEGAFFSSSSSKMRDCSLAFSIMERTENRRKAFLMRYVTLLPSAPPLCDSNIPVRGGSQ